MATRRARYVTAAVIIAQGGKLGTLLAALGPHPLPRVQVDEPVILASLSLYRRIDEPRTLQPLAQVTERFAQWAINSGRAVRYSGPTQNHPKIEPMAKANIGDDSSHGDPVVPISFI